MPRRHLPAWLTLAILGGCGGPEPTVGPKAPHGGTIAALPNELGMVEIVRRDSPDQRNMTQVLLYFLDVEGHPIAKAPTSATFKPRDRDAKAIAFKPAAASDPATAGALESPAFPAGGDLSGDLSVIIGGTTINVTIGVR